MTVEPIYDTNPKVPAVDVESNSDKDIPSGANFSKINKSRDDMEVDIEGRTKDRKI